MSGSSHARQSVHLRLEQLGFKVTLEISGEAA